MSSRNHKAKVAPESDLATLYSVIMSRGGASVADLKCSPRVCRVLEHRVRNLLSARVVLAREEGEGYWELTRVRDDFSIILSHLTYENPRVNFAPDDGQVQLNFKLWGELNYRVSRSSTEGCDEALFHVWRGPNGMDSRTRMAPCSPQPRLTITVRPEFMLEHLLPSNGDVPGPLRALVSTSHWQSNECQLPLTPQMTAITTRLIDNPYQGALSLTYVEALALELLCFAVANFWSLADRASEVYSGCELRALRTARQMLIEQNVPAPMLQNIARSVGLAENTLEHGFKIVYGENLCDFDLRCRMQRALTLLRDDDWSVDRVTEISGYSDTTTFVTAFHRHFGLSPVDLQAKTAGSHGVA